MTLLSSLLSPGGAIKNNFTAIVDPTINDDLSEGYTVGSHWINTVTGEVFILVDNTIGAAVWTDLSDGEGLTFQGTWNAATNTPFLQSSVGPTGDFYIVSVAGNTNLDGITDWNVGDMLFKSPTVWQKVPNVQSIPVTDLLTIGVNGQTVFTLSESVIDPNSFFLVLNSNIFLINGVHYTVSGTTLTWLDPDGLTLLTNDQFTARYNVNTTVVSSKFAWFEATLYNDENFDYKTRNIGASGSQNFSFKVPPDFISITSIKLIGQPSGGAAGSGKNIDISSTYGTYGEAANIHVESDTTTVYDFSGTTNQNIEAIDLSIILNNLSANDIVGIEIDHNGIGGAIDYIGIDLRYI